MHLVYECAALQMVWHDMPILFQSVHSTRVFMWQDNMILRSGYVHEAIRVVRASSSGDELDL